MKLERGILVVTQVGKNKPSRIQVRIGDKLFNVAQGEVSQSVLDRLQELNGKEIEFERVGGQPKKIREAGGEFIPPGAKQHGGTARQPEASAPRAQPLSRSAGSARQERRFHNPYNFIPAPPRKPEDPDLGDSEPVKQDRYEAGRYTGCIRVRMKVVTPLLVLDPENRRELENGHQIFPVLRSPDGKPLIAASGVRGMLRSAYEAITNSRFCRFSDEYKSRLAYRMEAREGLRMIPARISGGKIHLLTGTSKVKEDGAPDGPMYAAWLPVYGVSQRDQQGRVRADLGHENRVSAWVELVQHHRWDAKEKRHIKDFQFWRVGVVATGQEELGDAPEPSKPPPDRPGSSRYEPLGKVRLVKEGFVCRTNRNINRKHDERVFFQDEEGEKLNPFPLTEKLEKQWQELIENYQRLHADEIAQRRSRGVSPDEYRGHEPGQTAWSRHVYDPQYRELRDGTLCYARLDRDKKQVEALFPVMISRELYQCSPWDLLPESLRPAKEIHELSPADRVFGWVRSEPTSARQERVAARGLVRVGPVRCETEDAIANFHQPLPLAILSTPEPQQGRFYVAKSPQGEAQESGRTKVQAGYCSGKGLRGRKVYPHHRNLSDRHWENPLEDRTQQGPPYQEYRRPQRNGEEQLDNQNRSVCGWVKAGTEFTFDLYVENLSLVELGALLWLLKLPEEHYLRLGGGRPLGFGSVRLDIGSCDLRTPEGLKRWYSGWHCKDAEGDPTDSAIKAFQAAVQRAYAPKAEGFEAVPFIAAFLRACRGFDDELPIHYPRVTPAPDPAGENYRWFVENERQGRYALPDLVDDPGLPLLCPQSARRG